MSAPIRPYVRVAGATEEFRRGCECCGELLVSDACPVESHCQQCCFCQTCRVCGDLVDQLHSDGLCDSCEPLDTS